MVIALAARSPQGLLERFEYDAGPLGADEVDVKVKACGVCHSDLSMLNNDWGMAKYPFVPGHEASGTIAAVGADVKHLKVGQTVGVGWTSASCGTCTQCMSGDHNLCPTAQGTIVGRHGGFATSVRCQSSWAIPIPAGLDVATIGPMFCGGITVFNPMVQFNVKPTDRVGVVGIGGLGHMALQFLNKWGCEVFAFTSSDSKRDEAKKMGAHEVVNSTDSKQLDKIKGRLDFIMIAVNVTLDWPTYLNCLAPKGRLHFLGAVLEPINVQAMSLIMSQRSISGSPTGSPVNIAKMLEFCARHKIAPITETFAMSKANDALAHLRAGKARYRLVLENDLR
jgi:uncharacterized zinc-type alcohol dehydrogenase-like protein